MKLSKEAKQRIAIAKDALAWEKAGALLVKTQNYVRPEGGWDSVVADDRAQARDVVLGKCHVCALGGLLLAKAVRYDAVSVGHLTNQNLRPLQDHFGADQINEIEAAFEGESYIGINGTYEGKVSNPEWKRRYPVDSPRFRAIMRNIIRNGGTFMPEDY